MSFAWPGEDMTGPARDLGCGDATWFAVNEEELDVLAGHDASGKVSNLSR